MEPAALHDDLQKPMGIGVTPADQLLFGSVGSDLAGHASDSVCERNLLDLGWGSWLSHVLAEPEPNTERD